jgi:glycine cleavage system aminomethyltransferase T
VLRKREAGLERRMVQFLLRDPDAMVYHNEPILRDGRIVGTVTSGNYGHALGGAVAMGYVPCPGESADDLLAARFEIDVAGRNIPAQASLKPLYDPTAARTRL